METKEYKVVVMTITPEMAKEMLKKNPVNRQVRETAVMHFARLMKNGEWKENVSQPIAFDKDGNLLDGQHRLNAVIKANIAVRMSVIYGANREDFSVIDTGRPRGVADVLYIQNIKAYSAVAGAIKAYWQIKQNMASSHRQELDLSNANALNEYARIPELYQDAVKLGGRVYRNSRLLQPAEVSGICVYLVDEKHHAFEEVENFFNELMGGVELNAVKILRRIIQRSLNSPLYKERLNIKARRALIAKAWNAYITRIDVKQLCYKPSEKVVWL